jgi:two-component system LytT family sensor kinase
MTGTPAILAGEWIALPFAIGCGFAGGGLREICPKEAIWHFSPLFFTDLHRYVWRFVRRLQIDWIVLLLAAPISLELLRQWLGHRFGKIYYPGLYHTVTSAATSASLHTAPTAWLLGLIVFATVLGVAIPIKIWNSARIEHRLQEQEKLLLAARIAALASQINPHFLFNTLTSISSLIRSQPETARTLIVKLSGLLRRLLRSQEHFVTLREELEAIDEYLDIEAVRFGPKLTIEKSIDPASLDVVVPSMLLQPLVENCIKHGLSPKIGEGRILIRSSRHDGHSIIDIIDNGVGVTHRDHGVGAPHGPTERANLTAGSGIGLQNVNERLRVIYGANYQLQLDSVPGGGTCARIVIPELVVPAKIPA